MERDFHDSVRERRALIDPDKEGLPRAIGKTVVFSGLYAGSVWALYEGVEKIREIFSSGLYESIF